MTETTERTALGEKILNHWREHCQQMVRDLELKGRLDQAVFAAQETTGDLLYELVSVRKMNYPAAWELATQEWALPQEENKSGSQDPNTSGDLPPAASLTGTTSSGNSTQENSTKATSHRRRPRLRRATSG